MSKTVVSGEWLVAGRRPGRAQNRDHFPIVSPIDAEVFLVHGDHRVVGEQFTQADQAQVSKIRALSRFRAGTWPRRMQPASLLARFPSEPFPPEAKTEGFP